MNIIVFGDSIAWGAFDYEGGGWVDRLKRKLYPDHFVYNCAISGNTSFEVLHRMTNELIDRQDEDDDLMLIIAIGINDSAKVDGKHMESKSEFKENIWNIINKVDRMGVDKLLFVGLTPVNEECTHPVEWDESLTYENSDIQEYDSLLRQICDAGSIQYINLSDKIFKEQTVDGVHLNEQAHMTIMDEIFSAINPSL